MPNKHVIHAHTIGVVDGKPKLPTTDRIEYGEIAINYAEGHETISLKNSNDEIVSFSSDRAIKTWINEDAKVVASALNDLFQRINNLKIDVYDEIENSASNMVSITYADLKDLRDNEELVPGQLYRITDYATTTVQEDTRSAGHAFDVIVTATDIDKLNENAKAVQHDGDTYFNNANLEAWELKYCLDNDTTKFSWADTTNGKGIIYYMKDEWNNECPYDFKNIQFKRPLTNGVLDETSGTDTWVYTFNVYHITDNDTEYLDASMLNGVIIEIEGEENETFPLCCNNNIIKNGNTLGNYWETFQQHYILNNNVFLNIYDEVNGEYFSNTMNNINGFENTFGTSCNRNTLRLDSNYNVFGHYCNTIILNNICCDNTFGHECRNITFGINCCRNTFGDVCNNILFLDESSNNTFGNVCGGITFGYCCVLNSFGNHCESITFGNHVSSITFGYSYTIKDYYACISIEDNNQGISLDTSATTSSSNYLQRIHIAHGVNLNGMTNKHIIHTTVGDTFVTTYQNTNSVTVNV